MIYFLQGTEEYFIQQETDKIISNAKLSSTDLIQFSATEIPFSMLALEMNSDDIFGAPKVLVLKDLEQQKLTEYITGNNENIFKLMHESNNILIIRFFREEDLSKTLQKDLQALLAYSKIIDTKKQKEQGIVNFIQKQLKSRVHTLSQKQMQELAQKYHNNIELIDNELKRIMLEKTDDETITFDDFRSNSEFLEEQVFDLIQVLESKDVTKTIQVLDNILLHQQNVFGLLALLLKNYKEMYQIKTLSQVGYNVQQSAARLSIHPYRTKLLLKNAQNISLANFPLILQKIIDAEILLKSGAKQNLVIRELLIYLLSYN